MQGVQAKPMNYSHAVYVPTVVAKWTSKPTVVRLWGLWTHDQAKYWDPIENSTFLWRGCYIFNIFTNVMFYGFTAASLVGSNRFCFLSSEGLHTFDHTDQKYLNNLKIKLCNICCLLTNHNGLGLVISRTHSKIIDLPQNKYLQLYFLGPLGPLISMATLQLNNFLVSFSETCLYWCIEYILHSSLSASGHNVIWMSRR